MDFGPAWHCYSGQRAAYASGPTLTDRRHDEQKGSPYDAKCGGKKYFIFIIWDVLDEDAAGTIGRKRDNNVFITKFLISVQIKVIVMMLLFRVHTLFGSSNSMTFHDFP